MDALHDNHVFNLETYGKRRSTLVVCVLVRKSCLFKGEDGVMELPNDPLLSHSMVEHATGVGLKLI